MSSTPVLIVDDDPMIAVLLQEVIRQPGGGFVCDSTWAASGAAARHELKNGRFALVLLDYQLPDEDGFSVLTAINVMPASERPVVIMLTGAGNEQVAVTAMKMGVKDYLAKPFLDLPAMRHSIVTVLEHRRLEEQLAQSTASLHQKNVEMEADLVLARGVQQALLPRDVPVFPPGVSPEHSTLRFFHRWIPSEKIGGDLFDVFRVGRDSAGVLLYDVMGHGVRAALVTALLRGLSRERLPVADRPALFLAAINQALHNLLGQAGDLVFVTAVYGLIDAANGRVTLVNAGHPAPLHLRRRTQAVAPLSHVEGPGPALGLLPDTTYSELQVTLEDGDALLLFTDGLFETANASGEEFGRSRLRDAVETRIRLPIPSMLDAVLGEIRAFQATGASGFDDDVCLVAVERDERKN